MNDDDREENPLAKLLEGEKCETCGNSDWEQKEDVKVISETEQSITFICSHCHNIYGGSDEE